MSNKNNINMKKVTLAFLIATVALISSCGSNETKTETQPTDSTLTDTIVVVDTVKVDTVKTK